MCIALFRVSFTRLAGTEHLLKLVELFKLYGGLIADSNIEAGNMWIDVEIDENLILLHSFKNDFTVERILKAKNPDEMGSKATQKCGQSI